MPQFDYDSLAACLDERDEAKVTAFLWQVRLDFDTLDARNQDERNRAEVTQRIALLVQLMNDPSIIPEALVKRRLILAAAGKEVGLSDLHGQLRQFAEDIGTAVLASPDPVNKLDRILHATPKEGRPKRPFEERIAVAEEVQIKRCLEGMSLENACKEVAKTTRPYGKEAVRRIYENVRRDKTGSKIMRVISADAGVAKKAPRN